VFVLRVLFRMNAIYRAGVHACSVFRSDTGFRNDKRHGVLLLPSAMEPTYSLLVLCRSRSLLQHLAIPDSAFACIARQLEVLGQLKSIHRTGILTEATEHAAREVVSERRQVLATGLLVPLAGHHNQVLRAGQRAKIAGNAECFIGVGIDIEPWRTPIAFS